MTQYTEKTIAITGIGQSKMYRKPTVYPFNLCVDACLAAIEDAGLKPDDIDGIACWPPGIAHQGHGTSAAATVDVKNSLGLKLNWYSSGHGPAQYGSILNGIGAIASGQCKHVLCYRAEGERWVPMYSHAYQDGGMPQATGFMQWMLPYWAPSAGNWLALNADLHMRRTGLKREQLGEIAVNQRKNAALNPNAVYQDPITLDDYMSSKIISTPFCMYDCDVPIDGAAAVVISRLEEAKDMKQTPIRFEAVSGAMYGHETWFGREDFPAQALTDAGRMLWTRTDLKVADLDTAHLYDGFSWLVVAWLEALGITKPGETGPWLEGGKRIALDGELPLNTNGGQLSEGRLHAFNHLVECVRQLRGEAGPRQVKDAKVSVCGAGGGVYGSALLLTNQ